MRTVSRYRNLPVKRKLVLIIMATVGASLTLALGANLVFADFVLRSDIMTDLEILAEVAGSTALPCSSPMTHPPQPNFSLRSGRSGISPPRLSSPATGKFSRNTSAIPARWGRCRRFIVKELGWKMTGLWSIAWSLSRARAKASSMSNPTRVRCMHGCCASFR